MKITRIDIVGLGALGTMYAGYFSEHIGRENVRVLMDAERLKKYQMNGSWVNGKQLDLNAVDAAMETEPAQLMVFAVKYSGLRAAMDSVAHLIGDGTVIMSLLNGIRSEHELGERFGMEKIIYCTAQKMDATREGSHVRYVSHGDLALGITQNGRRKNLDAVTDLLDRTAFPYFLPDDMQKALWSKLVCNVGVNQAVAYFEGTYATVQTEGEPRTMMLDAMRECVAVGQAEGVALSEDDVVYWRDIVDRLAPEGLPSMRQDAKAGRKTEVELFAGTVCELGRKHGIATPVNNVFLKAFM